MVGVQTQIVIHRNCGESDIDAIEIGQKIAAHQQWHQAEKYCFDCPGLQFLGHCFLNFAAGAPSYELLVYIRWRSDV